jgi:Flp pilus assembly protein TadG
MPARLKFLPKLLAQFGALARDRRGVSAVEFALLAPLMISLYLGGAEISQAVSIDRKVSLVARAVADLTAQGTTISDTEMANILKAGGAVAAPYSSTILQVVVSSVKIDANSIAKVAWSDATTNAIARKKNDSVTLPTALVVANTSVIWAEVTYGYKPAIGYMITGTLPLTDQIYMRPRLQDAVCRVTCT